MFVQHFPRTPTVINHKQEVLTLQLRHNTQMNNLIDYSFVHGTHIRNTLHKKYETSIRKIVYNYNVLKYKTFCSFTIVRTKSVIRSRFTEYY